ncbi:MAG: hypothetical protein JSW47_11875, partial [Phycisphaerales bacterium]
MDRFLSALIFLRRAKRKLAQPVELRAIEVDAHVHRTNWIPAIDSREESFGRMGKLGQPGG